MKYNDEDKYVPWAAIGGAAFIGLVGLVSAIFGEPQPISAVNQFNTKVHGETHIEGHAAPLAPSRPSLTPSH